MDYGILPPEINSVRMYAGPGSGPMLAAASGWSALAVELGSAAADYQTLITRLTSEEWMGPASVAMAEAVKPYVGWLNRSAVEANHSATQARSAAVAYEEARAMTVPPTAIETNRAGLQSLLATNMLGQNSAQIAAAEAQYGEMWAQDAAAMYGYAGRSATATAVTPFARPRQTTNPAGLAAQAAAVTQATGTSAGNSSQVLATVPTTLRGMGRLLPSAASTGASDSGLDTVLGGLLGSGENPLAGGPLDLWSKYAGPVYNTLGLPYFSTGIANSMLSVGKALMPAAKAASEGAKAAAGLGGVGGLGGLLGGAMGGGAPMTAGLGQAAAVGKLSVPVSWAASGPAMAVPAAATPVSTISAVSPDIGAGNMLGGMPLSGAAAGATGAGPKYGVRPTFVVRSPVAG